MNLEKDEILKALEHLNVNQQKYLFTLYQLQITGVKQSELAEEIGVSRPAANRIIQELIELGYIRQKSRYEICLSEDGSRIAEMLDDQLTTIVWYLMDDMEIDYEYARRYSLNAALEMPMDYREELLKKVEKQKDKNLVQHKDKVVLQHVLKLGEYQLPFQLLQFKKDEPSMGDEGFLHPCTLYLDAENSTVVLSLCDLNCKSQAGRLLTGRLKKLWYNNNSSWAEAEVTATECRIPADKMQLTLDSHGTLRSGEIQVRVLANVGHLAMPESYARLKFNFRSSKKIKA